MTIRKVLRWGWGLGVRIPMSIVREVDLREGSRVDIALENGRIVLEQVDHGPVLEDILAEVTPENLPGEIGWGPATGSQGGVA